MVISLRMDIIDRIWEASTLQPNGCIKCHLGTTTFPYAIVHDKRKRKGKRYAHAIIYEDAIGAIPDGWHVHHECRTTRCINPVHLRCLSPGEHSKLHGQEKRHRTHCHIGHSMEDSVWVRRTNRPPERWCRTCMKIAQKKVNQRRVRENAEQRAKRSPKPPKTHCKRGHRWIPENRHVRPNGKNYCTACMRELANARYRRLHPEVQRIAPLRKHPL